MCPIRATFSGLQIYVHRTLLRATSGRAGPVHDDDWEVAHDTGIETATKAETETETDIENVKPQPLTVGGGYELAFDTPQIPPLGLVYRDWPMGC